MGINRPSVVNQSLSNIFVYCINAKNAVISGPVMRPSQKTKEERKWVLDTINKYFDVIVEEEDEEKEDDEDEDQESNEVTKTKEDREVAEFIKAFVQSRQYVLT